MPRRPCEDVSRITFTKAPAPELAGKIKAQQNAGRVDIDLVLTGTDGLAAGIEQGLWIELLPKYADKFGNLEGTYIEERGEDAEARPRQRDHCRLLPLGTAPRVHAREGEAAAADSAEELLAWCKDNPNRFMYARPANSGPGRTFLMGLP